MIYQVVVVLIWFNWSVNCAQPISKSSPPQGDPDDDFTLVGAIKVPKILRRSSINGGETNGQQLREASDSQQSVNDEESLRSIQPRSSFQSNRAASGLIPISGYISNYYSPTGLPRPTLTGSSTIKNEKKLSSVEYESEPFREVEETLPPNDRTPSGHNPVRPIEPYFNYDGSYYRPTTNYYNDPNQARTHPMIIPFDPRVAGSRGYSPYDRSPYYPDSGHYPARYPNNYNPYPLPYPSYYPQLPQATNYYPNYQTAPPNTSPYYPAPLTSPLPPTPVYPQAYPPQLIQNNPYGGYSNYPYGSNQVNYPPRSSPQPYGSTPIGQHVPYSVPGYPPYSPSPVNTASNYRNRGFLLGPAASNSYPNVVKYSKNADVNQKATTREAGQEKGNKKVSLS